MTESISAEELQQLMAGYVLYDLSPEESVTLEQLMTENPAIAQEIAQMQQALELAYAPAEMPPSEALRASVLSAHQVTAPLPQLSQPTLITDDRPLTLEPVPLSATRSKWQRWSIGLGAAAAVLITGLSVSNHLLWQSLQTLQAQQQETETMLVSLQPVEGTDGAAAATVKLDLANLQATLETTNLPPLSKDEVYALWTVLEPDAPFTKDDKDAILTSTLTPADLTSDPTEILLPPVYREQQWIVAIAITIEAADAPQRHEAKPILFTPL